MKATFADRNTVAKNKKLISLRWQIRRIEESMKLLEVQRVLYRLGLERLTVLKHISCDNHNYDYQWIYDYAYKKYLDRLKCNRRWFWWF